MFENTMSNYITTYTGKYFEPAKPDADKICIEDIAHALSLICRGNGHVKTFWSVGQHCINCAKEAWARGLPNRMALGEQIIEELQYMTGPDEDFPLLDIGILNRVIHKFKILQTEHEYRAGMSAYDRIAEIAGVIDTENEGYERLGERSRPLLILGRLIRMRARTTMTNIRLCI